MAAGSLTDEEARSLVGRVEARDGTIFDEVSADGYLLALRLLSTLESLVVREGECAEGTDEAARVRGLRVGCARVLAVVGSACPGMWSAMASGDALRRWVYTDLQSEDAECAKSALDFLGLMCLGDPLPAATTCLLGRNLVRMLLDIALQTKDAESEDGTRLPAVCSASLFALAAVHRQLLACGEESRVLDALVAHRDSESGVVGQLLVVFVNRHLEDQTWGGVLGDFFHSLASRPVALTAVMYENDLKVLVSVLSRQLEDLPVVLAAPGEGSGTDVDAPRERVSRILTDVFSDSVMRMKVEESTPHLKETLRWLCSENLCSAFSESARRLLELLG